MQKRLYRSRTDRVISGVCGGLGDYFDIDPTIVRLVFVALTLLTSGIWILIYIVMAIVVPEEPREGEAVPASPSTGEQFASAGRSFGEDVRAAAHRVSQPSAPRTSGVAAGAAAGEAAKAESVEAEGVGAEAEGTEGEPAEPPGETGAAGEAAPAGQTVPAPSGAAEAPPPPAPPPRRRGGLGGVVIGVVLVAFGALLLLERVTGIDLFAFGWRIVLPLLVIGLGLLILVRAAQRR